MTKLWRRILRWFTLADVPVNHSSTCDLCDERAVIFISINTFSANPQNQQLCFTHQPESWRMPPTQPPGRSGKWEEKPDGSWGPVHDERREN